MTTPLELAITASIEAAAPANYGSRSAEQLYAELGGDAAKLERLLKTSALPTIMNASTLEWMELPPPRWAVGGLLVEGLNLLVGGPKLGKSFLSLNVAVAVAAGGKALGHIDVEAGPVLYLALEDNLRRLKTRMQSMLPGAHFPPTLLLSTSWPNAEEMGLELLSAYLRSHKETRLVIVDTLAVLWQDEQAGSKRGNAYHQEYRQMRRLKRVADEHAVCLLAVHHTNKSGSTDSFDRISGTQAIGGACDAVLYLERKRGEMDAQLSVSGRDVEERELALRFDERLQTWILLGDAHEYTVSQERRAIIECLREAEGRGDGPLSPKDLHELTSIPYDSVRQLVGKMVDAREIRRAGRGRYAPRLVDSGDGYPVHNGHNGGDEPPEGPLVNGTSLL